MKKMIYDNPKSNRRELWVGDELRVQIASKYVGGNTQHTTSDDFVTLPWVPYQRVVYEN